MQRNMVPTPQPPNKEKAEKAIVRVGYYSLSGRILGKGHFARVEEAKHTLLSNQKVAIKIIIIENIKDEYILKNLKREAKILSKISHPNIVFLFETILTSRRYYIVTELVVGGDLSHFIKTQRRGKLDEKQARPLARQLVSAVGHLHELGIVHRDLKMENILLDENQENLKIVDFGLSNFCKFDQLLKTHCGSPEYAAPELYISGRKYGPEVDIWSLGVICYAMLVGRLPFESWYSPGLTQDDKRKHLIRETKKGLTYRHEKRLMELSCLFRNLIAKMLCPRPEDRISIQELQMHSWVYGNCQRAYPVLEAEWHKGTFQKIAKIVQTPISEVCHKIKSTPYGYVGGLYNILKFTEYSQRVTLTCPKISYKNIENEIQTAMESFQPLRKLNVKHPYNQRPATAAKAEHRCKHKVEEEVAKKTEKKKSFIGYFNAKFSNAFQKPDSSNADQKVIKPVLSKQSAIGRECKKECSAKKCSSQVLKKTGGVPLHTAARALRRRESAKINS